MQAMGFYVQSQTASAGSQRKPDMLRQEELDDDIAREITRIPDVGAFDRLSHVVGLSKLCCHRFVQLGGVKQMISAGLMGRKPTSAEACRTAAHVNVFCKLHEARDQVPPEGFSSATTPLSVVQGASE